jgi:hypothetical protein
MVVKKYIKGGLNSDVNQSLMPDGDYLNALNIRTQVGDDGKAGIIRPVPGNTLKSEFVEQYPIQYSIDNRDVKHMVVDEVTGDVYAFISGDIIRPQSGPIPAIVIKPHIAKINTTDGSYEAVLGIAGVDDLWEPSTDTTYLWDDLVQAKIVGDTLIWINKHGYQFSINVKAILNDIPGEPGYLNSKLDRRDVSLIKAPPAFNLEVKKFEDGLYTGVNYIKDSVFQFAYRYIYAGYEQSIVSPWSNEIPLNVDTDDYNYIKISIPINESIPSSVVYIDIISKNNITGAINLIKRFSSLDVDFVEKIIEHNNGVEKISFDFYNDNVYESIDNAYFFKQFDSVPVKSYSIEVAKDRLFLANNTEGYDAPDFIDISINPSTQEASGTRNIYYSLQEFNDINVYDNVASTNLVGEYYYWRNIMYIDGIDEYGYYYANGDIDGLGNSTVSDNGISLGSIDLNYPYVCEINSNPGVIDFIADTIIIPGCEIYVTGFANDENNGYYVVEEVAASDTLLVVKSDNVLPTEEVASASVSITLLSSLYATTAGAVSSVPTPVNNAYSDLVYIGSTPDSVPTSSYFAHRDFDTYPSSEFVTFGDFTITGSGSDVDITGLPTSQTRTFKSASRYNVGVQFYDFAMRKCGVITKTRNQDYELIDMTVSIPDRGYTGSNLQTFISWGLTPGTQLEIPEWAKYYSIVRTDNLDTRYFIQGKTKDITTGEELSYATKNASTGDYTISATKLTHDSTVVGISLDLETMLNDGFGYIYEEANGDVVKLYKDSGEKYILKVIGQQGRYIILEPKNIGDLTNELWIYEIRRPYKQSGSETFYESNIYAINNWGKSNRSYSVVSGAILGDTFIYADKEYMNLRNDFRNTWSRNLGRACFIDPIGQVYKPNGIRWSNTFVPGSQINGLSSFEAIDFKDAPVELGPINKLQTTSKTQSEGNVMLAIGQNYTASMYLGETSVVDNAGQSLLSTSGAVIGTINVLKGRFGTTVPTSVVEYDGNVYWADVLNECIVRYSGNGLFAISDLGMRNYFRSYFKALKSSINEYDITQSPYMYGGYNPATDEYIISFIPVDESPEQYPDGSASRYSDIKMMYKTGTPAKSIAYSASQERWSSFYSHSGPYVYFGGKMYSFVKPNGWVSVFPPVYESGGLFVFDKDSTINSLGGAVKDSFITFPVNEAPNNIKIYQAISVEGDTAPTSTYVETFTPNNQVTNMVASDYVNREDMLYTEILRDRVSPNVCGTADQKMYKGDKIRGQHANISMVWENPTNFNIRFINVNIKDSIGHNKLSQ